MNSSVPNQRFVFSDPHSNSPYPHDVSRRRQQRMSQETTYTDFDTGHVIFLDRVNDERDIVEGGSVRRERRVTPPQDTIPNDGAFNEVYTGC